MKLNQKGEFDMEEVVLQAIHGSQDHPLRIGDIEIPCYIVEDGRRVLVLQGMLTALDMSQGTAGRGSGTRLSKFIRTKSLQSFVPKELADKINNPLKIRIPKGGEAYGYEATILADICETVIEARDQHKLNYQQVRIAIRCDILKRGFARVGIIALVDEATGYQEIRTKRALEEILAKFISKELLKWTKMFPDDFYREMFRLRGWQYSELSVKRPSFVGTLTNDLVYERLAPGVVEALKKETPKDEKGRRKHKFHQHLTEDTGQPRLREHLSAVIALMRASTSWNGFYRMIQRALPKYNVTSPLPFNEEDFTDE